MKKIIFTIYLLVLFSNLTIAQVSWDQTNGPTGFWCTGLNKNNDSLFAGSFYGDIYLSVDGGLNWQKTIVSKGENDFDTRTIFDFAFSDTKTFAASGYGLMEYSKTTNSWKVINIPLLTEEQNEYITEVKVDEGRIYVLSEGIYYSEDEGHTWVSFNGNMDATNIYSDLSFTDTAVVVRFNKSVIYTSKSNPQWSYMSGFSFFDAIALTTVGDTVIVSGDDGDFMKSTKLGTPWTNYFSIIAAAKSIAYYNNTLYALTENGLYICKDGNNFILINKHYLESVYLTFPQDIIVDETGIYINGRGGVAYSSDGGLTFEHRNKGIIGGSILSLIEFKNSIYAGTAYNGIVKSSDNGQTWTEVNNGIVLRQISNFFVYGDTLFALSGKGLFKSTNEGESWTQITTNSAKEMFLYQNKLILAEYSNLLISSDHGKTWVPFVTGLSSNGSKGVNGISLIGDDLFADSREGIIKYDAAAQTWSSHNTGLGANLFNRGYINVDTFFIATTSDGTFRASVNNPEWEKVYDTEFDKFQIINNVCYGYKYGLFESKDAGKTWKYSSYSTPSHETTFLLLTNETIFGGTRDEGVFISNDIPLNVQPVKNTISMNVYPNPVEDVLTISLSEISKGGLKIYSLSGTEISNSAFEPTNLIKFDASALDTGLYILQVITDKESISKIITIK